MCAESELWRGVDRDVQGWTRGERLSCAETRRETGVEGQRDVEICRPRRAGRDMQREKGVELRRGSGAEREGCRGAEGGADGADGGVQRERGAEGQRGVHERERGAERVSLRISTRLSISLSARLSARLGLRTSTSLAFCASLLASLCTSPSRSTPLPRLRLPLCTSLAPKADRLARVRGRCAFSHYFFKKCPKFPRVASAFWP